MFCPKCGKQLPDGVTVCDACNETLTQETTAAPQPEAPQTAAPQPTAPAVPTTPDGRPYGKHAYFCKAAPKKYKIINYIALALGLVCILLVIFSANNFINGSFFKIPIMSVIGDAADLDFDEAQDELDDMVADLEDAIDDDDLLEDFEREYDISFDDLEDELGVSVDEFLDMLSPLSLNNMVKIAEIFEDQDDTVLTVLETLLSIIRVWAGLIVVLLALAILFRKGWLTVLSYILAFLFFPLTGGFVYWLIGSVLFIALAVLFSKMKMEYKFYRRSLGL